MTFAVGRVAASEVHGQVMSSDSLLIVGAGGHGKVVAEAAMNSGWKVAGFLDDLMEQGSRVNEISVLGPLASLAVHRHLFSHLVVAVGDGPGRIELIERYLAMGLSVPVVADPSAAISRFAALGAGTVVLAQAAISAGARIGVGAIVNTGATVDHDCILEDGVHVCPGAHLAGNVMVGRTSWIGIGSSVRQRIRIGRNVMVGAGSVVVNDILDGQTVMGVPARARNRK